MLSKDFKRTNQCRLALAKENLFSDRLAFVLQKSTPMTAIFNYEYDTSFFFTVLYSHFSRLNWHLVRCSLLVMEQAGLLRHWINSYLPNPNQCSAQLSSGPGAATHQLSLNFLLSAFLLYGAGVAIALVAFVHEIIISYLQFIFIWDKIPTNDYFLVVVILGKATNTVMWYLCIYSFTYGFHVNRYPIKHLLSQNWCSTHYFELEYTISHYPSVFFISSFICICLLNLILKFQQIE